MITIHAFAAERPPADHASRIASVPYDVISTDEARVLADGNVESFLHVIRPAALGAVAPGGWTSRHPRASR